MTTAPVASSPKKRRSGSSSLPTTMIVTLIPVCVALNIVGGIIAHTLKLPVYLDMIGTAISAIVLGPWWGVLVGVLTNSGASLINGPTSLPFMLVNIVGALLWGYGVRSWKLGRTIPRFFLLNIIVAVVCTVVAAPIIVLVFGGATGAGADALTGTFLAVGQNLVGSVLSSNILTSLADKIIGGFVALAIIEALPKSLTNDIDIIKATPLKGILIAVAGIVVGVLVVVVFLAINAGGGA
ncbi:ECF transporter S component [Microbacterium esteraromaticum]|uniref:ECF transporter S component n=1 Tax=Microbacterium esteraromaticum TaxID=57043 RepID=A0A7D7WCX8_9MICO|nr:ECF transporter S component [Microbacterium esteraromaticum]QMU97117.1 ECF transporter S component [Microbacterium esteraromaticum]